ncbi:endonuclease domain-containing 1 protein isoform X4 [Dicentrarchus labrax]|uniref:endonuclease domain-containing 1 protein isoform X4 n=1 Tax=Dicentrarchus labrax TaxID=13489 RepID=UPI0021F60C4C|nr:endonuclease domain-containing 1 protein isoform X4 [Dicentrarchus labrax]
MVKLKTGSLWFLAAFLFLSTVPTVAEVVKKVSDCDQFLLEKTPPELPDILKGGKIQDQNRYKPICQTYDNERRFLTLYDTRNKIPVISAYQYKGEKEPGRPKDRWMIEPQLENEADKNKNMADEEKGKTYDHQAMDTDYTTSTQYNRGHLFPSIHASTKSDKTSTLTLTNIVPQEVTFNRETWSNMEKCIRCLMDHNCKSDGFVVVGQQPSPNNFLHNRVNIPSTLWSAFCCYNPKSKKWISAAHWGNNVDQSDNLPIKTLGELHQQLNNAQVFDKQCPLTKSVTDKMIKACPKICRSD